MFSREREGASTRPRRQAWRCEEISGECEEWGPWDSSGELELWSAHHEVKQSAHGGVAGVRLARFQVLQKRCALFFGNLSLEQAGAEMGHERGRFGAQFRRDEFADV